MITQEMMREWERERGKGMTSAIGEYTPAEFWMLVDEVKRLRQGYWDARAIMGFDNDGDRTPEAISSDFVKMMISDATSMRKDYDEACDEMQELRDELVVYMERTE